MNQQYPAPDPRTAVGAQPQQGQPLMQQNVTVNQPGFNHGPHIVLDVITCGVWIPMHILIWILSGAK